MSEKRHPSRHCPHTTYLTIGQDYDSIQDYVRNVVARRSSNNTVTLIDKNENGSNEHDEEDTIVTTTTTTTTSVIMPSIYMFYTDLQELRGLYTPIDYGGGIQYANGLIQLLQKSPPPSTSTMKQFSSSSSITALQIGLWLNGTIGCQNIVNGLLQEQIQQLFHYCIVEATGAVTMTTISKIYLRIGYEFDNPQFGYSDAPDLYRKAFRYIVQECYTLYSYETCRSKIDFVWHSWAASLLPRANVDDDDTKSYDATIATPIPTASSVSSPYSNNSNTDSVTVIPVVSSLDDYYPGDEYVDWVGISIFSQLYTDATVPTHVTQLGNPRTVRYVCTFAQRHNKPIMIAESTPFGGIDQLHDPWNDWFVPVLHLIDEYHIQMWSYIYCNWDHIPMWNNTGFGDSRLEQNHTVLQLWYQHVLDNPQFHPTNDANKQGCIDPYSSNKLQDPTVETDPWQNYGATLVSLSRAFERSREGTTGNDSSQSIFYLNSCWIALINVLLLLIAILVRWHIQRRNSKRRFYELLE